MELTLNESIYNTLRIKLIYKLNNSLLLKYRNRTYFFDPKELSLELTNLKIIREYFKNITFKEIRIQFQIETLRNRKISIFDLKESNGELFKHLSDNYEPAKNYDGITKFNFFVIRL